MPTLVFSDNFRRHLGELPTTGSGDTVREVLDAVLSAAALAYIVDERGRLRKHINVFVDNEPVLDRDALSDPVDERAEVCVMQALSGG